MKAVGRILVQETHGIRRFFYPLSIALSPPAGSAWSSLGAKPGTLRDPVQQVMPARRTWQQRPYGSVRVGRGNPYSYRDPLSP